MIIDLDLGQQVYAVLPHPNGALVVVGIIASIHIEPGFNTAVLLTPCGEEQGVPLDAVKALRVRDGEPAMYEVEYAVAGIVAELLAPKQASDPAPAPPPMAPAVGSSLPVEF